MSYFTKVTNLGAAQIASAIANNATVNIARMAVGDGAGNPTTPSETQTQLVNQVYDFAINNLIQDPDNPNYIIVEGIIPSNVGGWTVHEVGVFDNADNLIAVSNHAPAYKPVITEGTTRDMIIRVVLEVAQPDAIELTIDPSVVLASRQWVSDNYSLHIILPGGVTGQVLAKRSNQSGDTEWIDPVTGFNVVVDSIEETQVLSAGQSTVNLNLTTTSNFALYINGQRLHPDDYTIVTSTQFTLATAATGGEKLLIVQNDIASPNKFLKAQDNLSDLENATQARENLGLETPEYQESVITLLLDEYHNPNKGKCPLITERSGNPATWGGAWNPDWVWERDFVGRTMVGFDAADANFNALRKQVGENTHKLTLNELARHRHSVRRDSYGGSNGFALTDTKGHDESYGGDFTDYQGGDQPHNNIQKSQVINIWRRTV